MNIKKYHHNNNNNIYYTIYIIQEKDGEEPQIEQQRVPVNIDGDIGMTQAQ